MNAAPKTLRHLSELTAAGLAPARPARRAGTSRRAIRRRDHAGDGGADRPRRSARSDRAAVRARRGRARDAAAGDWPTRSATTPTARSTAWCTAIPTARCSSSPRPARSIAASASAARWSAPAPRPLSPQQLDAALGYIAAHHGNLGGHPDRRRPAGAVAAPAQAGGDAARGDRRMSRSIRVHTRIPVAEPSRVTPELVQRAQGERQGHLRGAARQPCARAHARGARSLRAADRRRHPDAEPVGAARRRQRRCRRRSAR